MNTHKLLLTVLMLVSVILTACAPAATPALTTIPPIAPTDVPPTSIPPTLAPIIAPATQAPTVKPLPEHVIAEWKVSDPGALTIGFDSVWVAGHHSLSTTRIDPASNTVIAVIKETGWQAEQTLVVGDALWVTGHRGDTTWIDPKTNTVTKNVPKVMGDLHLMVYGFNSLWASTSNDRLDRIDPATSQIIASIELGDGIADNNNVVLTTPAAVWVDHVDEQELIKIDPATNNIVSKTPYSKLISDAQALANVPAGKGTDFIWRLVTGGLLRIDATTGAGLTFLPLDVDQLGWGQSTVTDAAIWLAGEGQINRVNVATNQIDMTYPTDPGGTYICIGFGSIWLANYNKSLVQRLDVAP